MDGVVYQVVRHAAAHAVHADAILVGVGQLGEMVDVVVLGVVAGGRQRVAVAPGEVDAAHAQVVEVAAHDAVLRAPLDAHRQPGQVAEGAPGHQVRGAAAHLHPLASGDLEGKPPQHHVRRIRQSDQRLAQHRVTDLMALREGGAGRRPLGRSGAAPSPGLRLSHSPALPNGRPEVQRPRLAIHEPLAGGIQFRQGVLGVVARALAVAVAMVRRRQRDRLARGIDRFDALALIGPVPEPVAVEQDLLLAHPALGPVAVVGQAADFVAGDAVDAVGSAPDHVGHVRPPGVGPAGQSHALAVEEELRPAGGAPEALGPLGAGLRHAALRQAGQQHAAARRRVQPLQHLGVGDGRERLRREHHPAQEARLPRLGRAVEDGRVRGARVLLFQGERLRARPDAGADPDGHPAGGKGAGLLALADLIAGALQRGEGTQALRLVGRGLGARQGIAAIGGHIKADRRRGACRTAGEKQNAESSYDQADDLHICSPVPDP